MSDEHYFGHPKDNRPRHRSGPFFDPPHDEYDEHGRPLDYSSNEDPRTRPLNVENLRRMMRNRNPHGD